MEVLATIGAGRFANVVICKCSGRLVALKASSHIGGKGSDCIESEFNLLVWLQRGRSCERIVQAEKIVTAPGMGLSILMGLALGGSLHNHIAHRRGLSVTVTRLYTSQLVQALIHLALLGCIHRDIKANNVVVNHMGHVVLCDFNQAIVLNSSKPASFHSSPASRTFTLTGVPHSMSPEAVAGVGYDCAVDWWALGVLIYEMLTGHPPFQRAPGWPSSVDYGIAHNVIRSREGISLDVLKTWDFPTVNELACTDADSPQAPLPVSEGDLNAIVRRFEEAQRREESRILCHGIGFMTDCLAIEAASRLCMHGSRCSAERVLSHPWVLRVVAEGDEVGPSVEFDPQLGHAQWMTDERDDRGLINGF